MSCLLALLLPLKELQGEIHGIAETDIFDTQLQTGNIDVPSISTALKESVAVKFDLEEGETNQIEESNGDETTTNEEMGIKLSLLTLAQISLHELPKETHVPSMSSAVQKSGTVTIDIEEDETNPTERGKEVKMPSNLPSMSSAVQDSVVVTIDLEEDEINPAEGRNGDETTTNDDMGIELSLLTPTEISLYELPRETHDTPL